VTCASRATSETHCHDDMLLSSLSHLLPLLILHFHSTKEGRKEEREERRENWSICPPLFPSVHKWNKNKITMSRDTCILTRHLLLCAERFKERVALSRGYFIFVPLMKQKNSPAVPELASWCYLGPRTLNSVFLGPWTWLQVSSRFLNLALGVT
jgi:hypothetical protein